MKEAAYGASIRISRLEITPPHFFFLSLCLDSVPLSFPVPPSSTLLLFLELLAAAFSVPECLLTSDCHLSRPEPIGSMSSMEVNVDMLEQMDLMDMSDHEALDVFLHSGGEDNSAASPVKGPDVESFTTEISLQVPTQAEIRHKLSSLSSTCTDSASQDTEAGEDEEEEEEAEQGGGGVGGRRRKPPVVVTLDEEEVHADTLLVYREDREDQSSRDCEERRQQV
ncbi:dystrobrevin binding protein 1b isoform 3-T3 [Fundulus diaphanus]